MFGWFKPGHGGGLGLEPAEVGRVVEHVGAEDFERHRPIQADLAGEVDLAHSPTPEQALDLEVAQRLPGQVPRPPSRLGCSRAIPGGGFVDRLWR